MDSSNHSTCLPLASLNWVRALGTILFPILAIMVGIIILEAKHYDPIDYISLATSSAGWVISQLLGWAALIFWSVRFIPRAIMAMKHKLPLYCCESSIYLYDRRVGSLDVVDEFLFKRVPFDVRLIAKTEGFSEDWGSMIFLSGSPAELVARLNKLIPQYKL